MANTELLHWAVTHGRSSLGLGPLCNSTVTRKDFKTQLIPLTTTVNLVSAAKRGLVSLVTTVITVSNQTPESGLALQGTLMTPTRVATKQSLSTEQIMATSTSKRWDIFWSNKSCNTQKQPSSGLKMRLRNCSLFLKSG